MDTIFALASARGKAGVAVVRVSGPNALDALGRFICKPVKPRVAALRRLMDGDDLLDEAVVVYFPEGASFTGESVVEFQLHGSVAVVTRVIGILGSIKGYRPAEAGEFTRRALENGRLDLTQVEALADLIDADTEYQRRQAQRVLSGDLGNAVAEWRRDLIRVAALIEATIDFADEEVPEDVGPEILSLLSGLHRSMERKLAQSAGAERLRDGFEVAIVGAPNVGKSSLLNALAGREAAITSAVAGTTRDIIEVRMDIQGLPVTILDTAGIREIDDEIERIGISRARERSEKADLRLILLESISDEPVISPAPGDLIVYVKGDIYSDSNRVSSRTGKGIGELLAEIGDRLRSVSPESAILIRERHRSAVAKARDAILAAQIWATSNRDDSEFVASDVRTAIAALESLVGKVGVEDLLSEIFGSFCIGK